MLPVINIGPLALPAPEFILLLGFWIGLEITEKQAPRYGAAHYRVTPSQIYSLVLVALVAGLVGARLVYAARSPAAFLASPLNLLALRPEMLDGLGGLVFALVGAAISLRARRMPLWASLDALTTFLAVLAVTLGLSHFASGDAFGVPSKVPWAIDLWGQHRHPSQVYETLAALMIAIATWPGGWISRRSEHPAGGENLDVRPGLRFWAFLALSAAARLFLETFRGDSTLLMGMFRQAQVIAWLVLAISLWQIGRRLRPSARTEGQTI
jgi:phosphatidylglycerol---prolipoprotein diacylglyceryl transferase